MTTTDALVARSLNQLAIFTNWCQSNGVQGMIGEFGVMNGNDAGHEAQWVNLAQAYLNACSQAGVGALQWAAGRWYSGSDPQAVWTSGASYYGDGLTVEQTNDGPIKSSSKAKPTTFGVNLSGAEFFGPISNQNGTALLHDGTTHYSDLYPGVKNTDYVYPLTSDWSTLAQAGITLVRLPVAWERLQPTLSGALSSSAVSDLQAALNAAKSAGVNVILDLHNYGARWVGTSASASTMYVFGPATGQYLTHAMLADFWSRMVTQFKSQSNLISLDIMNEPAIRDNANSYSNTAQCVSNWKTLSQTVVNAIISAGWTKSVIVEGWWGAPPYDWLNKLGPSAWITGTGASQVVYSAHQYFDGASDYGAYSGTYHATPGPYTYVTELATLAPVTSSSSSPPSYEPASGAGNAFDIFVGDLRTGRIFTHLTPSACTWQQAPLNDAGTMAVTIQAADPDLAGKDLYHNTATARAFLAVAYNDRILNAGPIWARTYDSGNAQLQLSAMGLWSLFDHRKILPALAEPVVTTWTASGAVQSTAGDTSYPASSNLSLADIAKRLIQQATGHVGGNIPVVLPADQGMTPGATRTYYGYELKDLGPVLKELAAAGVEIRFTPQFTDGTRTAIQWVMQASSPTSPLLVQGGADWVFDRTAPQSPVADVKYAEDANNFATRAWATGNGSQRSILMSQADSTALTSAGYPLLEFEQTYTGVGDQPTLNAHTAALLTANNRPSAIWSLLIQQDGGLADEAAGSIVSAVPALGTFAVGDYAQIYTAGDPFLPDTPPGGRRVRIQQVSGDLSYAYSVACFGTKAEV